MYYDMTTVITIFDIKYVKSITKILGYLEKRYICTAN